MRPYCLISNLKPDSVQFKFRYFSFNWEIMIFKPWNFQIKYVIWYFIDLMKFFNFFFFCNCLLFTDILDCCIRKKGREKYNFYCATVGIEWVMIASYNIDFTTYNTQFIALSIYLHPCTLFVRKWLVSIVQYIMQIPNECTV